MRRGPAGGGNPQFNPVIVFHGSFLRLLNQLRVQSQAGQRADHGYSIKKHLLTCVGIFPGNSQKQHQAPICPIWSAGWLRSQQGAGGQCWRGKKRSTMCSFSMWLPALHHITSCSLLRKPSSTATGADYCPLDRDNHINSWFFATEITALGLIHVFRAFKKFLYLSHIVDW